MPRLPRPPKKILQRQLELRARLWPDLDLAELWSRHTHDGFSTIPSCMPLIMSIVDDMSKGSPASSTYLELWTRAYDEGFVTLAKPREMAFHAGFSTQRAERTWKQKLQLLDELGFINLKSGPSGPASYALLLNPYKVIKRHHEQKTPGLREDKYNALVARASEIGDASFGATAPAFAPWAPSASAVLFPSLASAPPNALAFNSGAPNPFAFNTGAPIPAFGPTSLTFGATPTPQQSDGTARAVDIKKKE